MNMGSNLDLRVGEIVYFPDPYFKVNRYIHRNTIEMKKPIVEKLAGHAGEQGFFGLEGLRGESGFPEFPGAVSSRLA